MNPHLLRELFPFELPFGARLVVLGKPLIVDFEHRVWCRRRRLRRVPGIPDRARSSRSRAGRHARRRAPGSRRCRTIRHRPRTPDCRGAGAARGPRPGDRGSAAPLRLADRALRDCAGLARSARGPTTADRAYRTPRRANRDNRPSRVDGSSTDAALASMAGLVAELLPLRRRATVEVTARGVVTTGSLFSAGTSAGVIRRPAAGRFRV